MDLRFVSKQELPQIWLFPVKAFPLFNSIFFLSRFYTCLSVFIFYLGTTASTHPLKPKVPVESKAVREEVAKSSALSCPICFCLNAGDAKKCIFCGNQLPATTQTSDQSLSRLPTPKLPSSQHSMQQSKGNASVVSSSGEGL